MTKERKKLGLTREERVAYLFIAVPVILFVVFTWRINFNNYNFGVTV